MAKTWHIDLGILWIAATWLGAGLFLPPLLTGHEPNASRRTSTCCSEPSSSSPSAPRRHLARVARLLRRPLVAVRQRRARVPRSREGLAGRTARRLRPVGRPLDSGPETAARPRAGVRPRPHDSVRRRLDCTAVYRRVLLHPGDQHRRHGVLALVGRPHVGRRGLRVLHRRHHRADAGVDEPAQPPQRREGSHASGLAGDEYGRHRRLPPLLVSACPTCGSPSGACSRR